MDTLLPCLPFSRKTTQELGQDESPLSQAEVFSAQRQARQSREIALNDPEFSILLTSAIVMTSTC